MATQPFPNPESVSLIGEALQNLEVNNDRNFNSGELVLTDFDVVDVKSTDMDAVVSLEADFESISEKNRSRLTIIKDKIGRTAFASFLTQDPWISGHILDKRANSYDPFIVKEATERTEVPFVTLRGATDEDIPTLVEIDLQAFKSVYKAYDIDQETLREELTEKFKGRLEKVGSKWIQIAEIDGVPKGFMVACPTNKKPEDFVSWEQTTDNGTLKTTYDPNGKYGYVVSLSVLPEASKLDAHNMLITRMVANMIEDGLELAFFESRLPNLKMWVKRECRNQGLSIDDLTPEQLDVFADTYMNLNKTVNGKTVKHDRLLRTYEAQGCRFIKVARNAYQDDPSMNYGVVCILDNPVPKELRRIPLFANSTAAAYKFVAKRPALLKKLLG